MFINLTNESLEPNILFIHLVSMFYEKWIQPTHKPNLAFEKIVFILFAFTYVTKICPYFSIIEHV
jgi:hypothetical protein